MSSNIPKDQEANDIHNNSLPKWLEDIAENKMKTHSLETQPNKKPTSSLYDAGAIYHRNDIEMVLPQECNYRTNNANGPSTAKFGRRAPITAQILASSSSTNSVLSKSEYLVPKLGEKFNFSSMHKDQDELELYWKSLSLFQKSHKGRLDSANDPSQTQLTVDYDKLGSLSSHSLRNPDAYAGLENIPFRSKSEMSAKFQQKSVTKKSKSSENVRQSILNDNLRMLLSAEDMERHPYSSHAYEGTKLEKQLNEYKLNMAKEDILRRKIIRELLSENELITKKISETNLSIRNRKILRSPSFEDVTNKTLQNKKTKHKNSHSSSESLQSISSSNNLVSSDLNEDFIIPELPSGKTLVFSILRTWGDKHYVGLNGIEIFGKDGKLVKIKMIIASPKDVNVLPECHNDPRVVTNLLDGVNRTQDDVHLWLAPFDKGKKHNISIEFVDETAVAMIRIWNYNKSRIHSYRGVKDMIITLDGVVVFKGEIAKACGGILGGVDAFGDTILFTLDNDILDLISQNDDSYLTLTSTVQPESPKEDRPPTSFMLPNDVIRPLTGMLVEPTRVKNVSKHQHQMLFGGNCLSVVLVSNWGNKNMIGLTGIEVVDDSESAVDLTKVQLSCNVNSELFSLSRLVNHQNLTVNPKDMWCVPYDYGQETIISIPFHYFTYITGVRIWNYNESLETTYAGVSRLKLLLDGKLIVNPITQEDFFLIRRAPGNLHYDFVQDIIIIPQEDDSRNTSLLTPAFNITHTHKEEFYEYPTMPEGFVIQFIIFSTWGDQYYCGLNGVELYEQSGSKIVLDSSNICAYPESINVLPTVKGDIRTPDKLIDGITDDLNGGHSWLAPIMPRTINRIYIVLDQPVTLSVIKIWNYSKTPARGVKEFGILVDDLLVYNGILDKYSPTQEANYGTVAFTDDANVIEQELDTLIRHSSSNQEVLLLNDNLRSTVGGSLSDADPTLRPYTSVSPVVRWNNSYT